MSPQAPLESRATRVDVAVVGAGPAGATCAFDLARAGFEVVILDKVAPPRYKTCGGGIAGRALEYLDVDVGASVERSVHRIELRLGDGSESWAFAVERSPAPVVMTMRSSFDACLVDAAVEAGAILLAPRAFRDLSRTRGHIEIATDRPRQALSGPPRSAGPAGSSGPVSSAAPTAGSGAHGMTISASWVIGADGVGSRVARAAGFGTAPRTVPAIESELEVPAEVFGHYAGAARFDFDAVPHGYGWVFPKRSHLSVGCLTTKPSAAREESRALGLNQHFERYLRALGVDRPLERQDHGFAIPIAPRDAPFGREGVLLIGDAAGFGDPLTCEGISNAIHSGQLAARAVLETRKAPHRTAKVYGDLLKRSILPELRWARRLAPLLYDHSRLRDFVFRRAGSALCEAFTDVFSGGRTYRDLLTRPAGYGRFLRMLVRSGAEA